MNNKIAITLLTLSIFFTGASGLVNEYILSTISTYILGNSIEQFSITIALMLGFMGVGSWAQRFVKDDYLLEKFIFIEILITVLGAYSSVTIYWAFANLTNGFDLIHYFFIISIGFLIGFEIPFIIRINEKYNLILKDNLSRILGADYIGALVGAFIWVYLLLPNIELQKIGFLIAGANFIVASITFLYIKKPSLLNVFLLGFVFFILYFGFNNSSKWTTTAEQKMYDDPIVYAKTTKYQHIVLTKNDILNEYRMYINGNVQFSSLDEKIYHEHLVHPIMSLVKEKKNILVLGAGDGLAIRELKKYKDIENITLVELDPQMIEISKTNEILKKLNGNSLENITIIPAKLKKTTTKETLYLEDENDVETDQVLTTINVINIDADIFLNNLNDIYDVIIIDFPDPSSIELVKLYTKEFYTKVNNILKKDGMIVVQSSSPYHAKESFLCIGRTLKSSGFEILPYHDNVPSFGDWGWHIAWKNNSVINKDIKDRINNMQIDVNTKYLTEQLFKSSLHFGKGILETENSVTNTLMFPKLLDIYRNNSWLEY